MINTPALKSFATEARTQLLSEVEARVNAILQPNSPERIETPGLVAQLEGAIHDAGDGDLGTSHVIERAAYGWFNRIVALRFMDLHGYSGVNVVSPAEGSTGFPEILALATAGQIDTDIVSEPDARGITELLNGVRRPKLGSDAHTEAYSLLLKAYCSFWNEALPFMFERRGSFLELLIPDNILAESSVLNKALQVLTPEACEDVEVIGWLYQFYIAERKDEVAAGFKEKPKKKAGADEIPPATQLFTPHWIVRYLAENSIGRLWLLNFPTSSLKSEMKYYIDPVDESIDFLRISSPEDIKIIDPACGSGHMLTYAFDLLYEMYQEHGYPASQIPNLILERNLFGTEIDERAGSLAAFALAMKAAGKRRLFLRRPVVPNICVLKPISFTNEEIKTLLTPDGDHAAEVQFWNLFEKADTFGSLLRPDAELTERLAAHVAELSVDPDIFVASCLDRARCVIEQAQYLARTYEVVIANPPYLGNNNMGDELSAFMKREYPMASKDLFAAFLLRCLGLAMERGTSAMITMQSWMFLANYEKLRGHLLYNQYLSSMAHLGSRAFDTISGNVVQTTAFVLHNIGSNQKDLLLDLKSAYIRLVEGKNEAQKSKALLEAAALGEASSNFYVITSRMMTRIKGSPRIYWLSEKLQEAFQLFPAVGSEIDVKIGMRTGNNERFLRFWWEVSRLNLYLDASSAQAVAESGRRWVPFNKGGTGRRWYGNQDYVVNWKDNGREIKEATLAAYPSLSWDNLGWKISNESYYFSPSVSWSDVGSGVSPFRYFPSGFIFSNKGNCVFAEHNRLLKLLAVLNSSTSESFLAALAPTMSANVGEIKKVPVPPTLDTLTTEPVNALIAAAKTDWDSAEISWNYETNPLVEMARQVGIHGFGDDLIRGGQAD